jgi:hypothetical protein
MRAVGTQVVPVLTLGPPSGFHAVSDDDSEGVDRQVLVAIESEDRGAVGAVADNGKSDNRHRVTLTQWTRQTDGESAAFTRLVGAAL